MAKIEVLAMVVANKIYSGWDTEKIRQLESAAAMAARQQDSISRQEERERCIEAAQDAHCRLCTRNSYFCRFCEDRDKIRKTIKEGGNQ